MASFRVDYADVNNANVIMKIKHYTGEEIKALRRKRSMNQRDFWAHFQITQSGASRYESGRDIPEPTQILLNIAFGTPSRSAQLVDTLRGLSKARR